MRHFQAGQLHLGAQLHQLVERQCVTLTAGAGLSEPLKAPCRCMGEVCHAVHWRAWTWRQVAVQAGQRTLRRTAGKDKGL